MVLGDDVNQASCNNTLIDTTARITREKFRNFHSDGEYAMSYIYVKKAAYEYR